MQVITIYHCGIDTNTCEVPATCVIPFDLETLLLERSYPKIMPSLFFFVVVFVIFTLQLPKKGKEPSSQVRMKYLYLRYKIEYSKCVFFSYRVS